MSIFGTYGNVLGESILNSETMCLRHYCRMLRVGIEFNGQRFVSPVNSLSPSLSLSPSSSASLSVYGAIVQFIKKAPYKLEHKHVSKSDRGISIFHNLIPSSRF